MLLKSKKLNAVFVAGAFVLLAASGCKVHKNPPGPGETPTPSPPSGTVSQSVKANVKFKRDLRMANHFADALQLSAEPLCTELGQYGCTAQVHTLALGGVSPYDDGVYEPAAETGVTAPLVVDRVALSVCATRTDADFADPTVGIIYRNLPLTPTGALADVNATQVDDAIATLIKRVNLRPARSNEYTHLKQLYTDIEATGAADPAREWGVLACFAVLTTTESIFY